VVEEEDPAVLAPGHPSVEAEAEAVEVSKVLDLKEALMGEALAVTLTVEARAATLIVEVLVVVAEEGHMEEVPVAEGEVRLVAAVPTEDGRRPEEVLEDTSRVVAREASVRLIAALIDHLSRGQCFR